MEGPRAWRAVPPQATERHAWGGAVDPPGRAAGGGVRGGGFGFWAQARFLNRQLSLPVSTISQWWVSRSKRAVVILASPNTLGHSPKARLVVTMTEVCS